MLLTGGPGTGKTTSLRGVLALFETLGLETALAAPTGRAAKRLGAVSYTHLSILSRYVSRDRVCSGCEVLTLQADGSYHNAGVSMKNGRRMSAWTAVLSEERGRT